MIKVGVIGLGMMGNTHLDVYAKQAGLEVLAISDANPDRLSGKELAKGNIAGQAQGSFNLDTVRKYDEGMKLIADPDIDLVDICLATPLHYEFALAALEAGKHVLVEKPLCRTASDAFKLAKAAETAKGFAMPAQCMRFWPGWDWVRDAIQTGEPYGRCYSAHFRRLGTSPGGPFYGNGELSGGALLDLHVHDIDFIQWCFGMPKAVHSTGCAKLTGAIDHVHTHYHVDADCVVTAEGGWHWGPLPFTMQFVVDFERATVTFGMGEGLTAYEVGANAGKPIEGRGGMGYQYEIEYLLDCIRAGSPPTTVTLADGARSVQIAEAEARSIAERATVSL